LALEKLPQKSYQQKTTILDNTLTLKAEELSQPELFKFMLAAVAPRPICFASTVDKEGSVNLSPYSFFNAFSSNPPIMVFAPCRNRDGNQKHTYHNVHEVPEVVINVVNYQMVEQQSLASTAYAKGVNEFIKAGFTEVSSDRVGPPRVGESPVAFECKVKEVKDLGNGPGAGSLVICEVLVVHINKGYLDDTGHIDSTKLDMVGRMGANWYSRASKDAMFEISKPLRSKGIGIDQLPKSIRESPVLTGNNLGRLGNVTELPNREEVIRLTEGMDFKNQSNIKAMHLIAQKLLKEGETMKAFGVLMLSDSAN